MSSAVPNATSADMESQKASQDVQKGFVADAYLANWDVVGLVYDNIVKGEDGFYRIDNGGSLIFRAQGGDKTYSHNSIPELQSMLKPKRPTGEVFAEIDEKEIEKQARELVDRLTAKDIVDIVDDSGLEGVDRDRILTGLLGRREFLAKTYGKPESIVEELNGLESGERRSRYIVSEAVRSLIGQEMERSGEMLFRSKIEIACDRDHIEGQKIEIIDKRDVGVIEFKFKLRTPDKVTTEMLASQSSSNPPGFTTTNGVALESGSIIYKAIDSDNSYVLCDALVFEKEEGVKIFIADHLRRDGQQDLIRTYCNDDGCVRTAIGLCKIEVAADMKPELIELALEEILEKDLGIPDALSEISEDAEREYKIARYGWQHVIAGELTPEQTEQALSLECEEVFPGYTTMIERGKHWEYLEKYGDDLRAVHGLHRGNAQSIYRILTQGLMSTTNRYSRGVLKNGMSSRADMDTGGADSVFTRIANKSQRNKHFSGSVVVFKPEIFDRTDWYSYRIDRFGTTSDKHFSSRLSPDAIIGAVTDYFYPHTNEQMFRAGIGANYVESIEVEDSDRNQLILELRSMGLEEFNGKPIEEVIVSRQASDNYEKQQSRIGAIIKGEAPYASFEEILDVTCPGGIVNKDSLDNTKSVIDLVIAHVDKERIANSINNFIKTGVSLAGLKELAADYSSSNYFLNLEKNMYSYFQNEMGVDYGKLYKEALTEHEMYNKTIG